MFIRCSRTLGCFRKQTGSKFTQSTPVEYIRRRRSCSVKPGAALSISSFTTMLSTRILAAVFTSVSLSNFAVATPVLAERQLPLGCPAGLTLQCCTTVLPNSVRAHNSTRLFALTRFAVTARRRNRNWMHRHQPHTYRCDMRSEYRVLQHPRNREWITPQKRLGCTDDRFSSLRVWQSWTASKPPRSYLAFHSLAYRR